MSVRLFLFRLPLMLLLGLVGTPAGAAGFDCTLARTRVEALVCGDPEVSKLDERLAAVYAQVQQSSLDRRQERAGQRAWLETRNACTSLTCVHDAYESRLVSLSVHLASAPQAWHPQGGPAGDARIAAVNAALERFSSDGAPYRIGWFDLDGDGRQEAIVLVTEGSWCGSGGCSLLVLKQDRSAWKVVSNTPACRAPVVLSNGSTRGWHDLAVTNVGGGDLVATTMLLQFQKHHYAKGRAIAPRDVGRTLIP